MTSMGITNNNCLILEMLDQDCLTEIFSYLTIYELIQVEQVCKDFLEVCKLIYPQYHDLRLELRYLKLYYFESILERVSPYLRSFQFSGGYILDDSVKRTLISGIRQSPQLRKLGINYTQFSRELMLDLSASSFQNLVSLDLSRCNLDEDIMEGIFGDSELFRNLKILLIAGNTMLTGKCFNRLKYLEELDASYCYDLNYTEFVRFLKTCEKLLRLDISACVKLLDGNIIEDLLHFQCHLEKIHFKYVGILSNDPRFKQFPKMKDLEIHGYVHGT